MGQRLFLDTYALVEVIEGNPNYDKFADCEGVTSVFNLYELYYRFFRKYGKDVADLFYGKFESITIEIEKQHIQKASEIKLKSKISFIDALGYAMAQSLGIKFLTGDNDFKNMKGVEFVK